MHCLLVVPDLLWPPTPGIEPYRDLELPALETLLARSALAVGPPNGLEACLCPLFGVAKQQDWPAAPITGSYDGVDTSHGYWMRCDPVNLDVQGLRLYVHEASTLPVAADEAAALAASLNEHFASEEIEIVAPAPDRWYLRLHREPQLATVPLGEVAGRDAGQFLPRGPDALEFQRLLTEAQMLMHGHRVNAAREARGDPPINGVWLWGGGTAPAPGSTDLERVWSNDVLAAALAARAAVAHAPPPPSASAWLSANRGLARHLIVLDMLSAAVRKRDLNAWQQAVLALERDWFRPLLAAVQTGALETLNVTAINATGTWFLAVTLRQLKRWWRRRKPLASYARAG